jgi:Tol biopolymer transport system component
MRRRELCKRTRRHDRPSSQKSTCGKGDIYVKQTGAGTPLQLTKGPAHDTNPAWSPDGRYIAFLRQSEGSSGLYLIPGLGGPEIKLVEASPNGNCRSLDWHPDGKSLAVTDKGSPQDPFSIFLVSRETGEKRKLTSPPAQTISDGGLAFSPDGKTLAFTRSVGIRIDDIYLMPVEGGEPQRLTLDNRSLHGPAWTPDSREIVFSSNRGGGFGLWRFPVTGGAPKPLVAVGQNAFHPSLCRSWDHLVYEQNVTDSNIWRMEITGSPRRGNPLTRLIFSTQSESSPQYSPDGKRIVFTSDRSGSPEIWVCDSNGDQPLQLTNFVGPDTGTPRWSPDGSRIAFGSTAAGQTDIYMISAEGGSVRRLTMEPSDDVRPSWSRDGGWIYFGSNRSRDWQVWKMPAEGGQAVPVTKQVEEKPSSRPTVSSSTMPKAATALGAFGGFRSEAARRFASSTRYPRAIGPFWIRGFISLTRRRSPVRPFNSSALQRNK